MQNRKKKIRLLSLLLSLTFVAALCFTLVGCGSGEPQQEPPAETPSSSETEIVSQDPNAVTATASIVSTGDILIHSPFLTSYYDEETDTYDFKEIFQYVKQYTQQADYAVANLEVSLSGNAPYSGYPCFNCPDAILDALKDSGFDMLLTANNHVGDTGVSGFERTQSVIGQKGFDWMGSVQNLTDKRYKVVDVNGIKIGMVNYSYIGYMDGTTYLNGVPISDDFAAKLNTFDYNNLDAFYSEMEQMMTDMKNDGAEATIMYIHWGEEYHLEPMDYQKEIAQKIADIGFDVTIGGHPHVIEPVEVITSKSGKKMPVLYSMGNELSNQRRELLAEDIPTPHTEDGLLFYTNFSRKGDGSVELTSIDVLPTWVNMYYNENGRRTYEIAPLDKEADWANFNLSGSMELAQGSYDRTMELVGDGIDAYNGVLSWSGSTGFESENNEDPNSWNADAPVENAA